MDFMKNDPDAFKPWEQRAATQAVFKSQITCDELSVKLKISLALININLQVTSNTTMKDKGQYIVAQYRARPKPP